MIAWYHWYPKKHYWLYRQHDNYTTLEKLVIICIRINPPNQANRFWELN